MTAYLQSLRQAVAKAKQLPRGGDPFPHHCTRATPTKQGSGAFSSQTPARSHAGEGARSGRPPVTAGSNYRYWELYEDIILAGEIRDGATFREVGERLGRTKDSCIGRFHRLTREGV